MLRNQFVKILDPGRRLRRDATHEKVMERGDGTQTEYRTIFCSTVSLRKAREKDVARPHGTRSFSEYSASDSP